MYWDTQEAWRGGVSHKKSYNLSLFISHLTHYFHLQIEKEGWLEDVWHLGNEGVKDHHREAEIVSKRNQKINGAKAQARGAKWGM